MLTISRQTRCSNCRVLMRQDSAFHAVISPRPIGLESRSRVKSGGQQPRPRPHAPEKVYVLPITRNINASNADHPRISLERKLRGPSRNATWRPSWQAAFSLFDGQCAQVRFFLCVKMASNLSACSSVQRKPVRWSRICVQPFSRSASRATKPHRPDRREFAAQSTAAPAEGEFRSKPWPGGYAEAAELTEREKGELPRRWARDLKPAA